MTGPGSPGCPRRVERSHLHLVHQTSCFVYSIEFGRSFMLKAQQVFWVSYLLMTPHLLVKSKIMSRGVSIKTRLLQDCAADWSSGGLPLATPFYEISHYSASSRCSTVAAGSTWISFRYLTYRERQWSGLQISIFGPDFKTFSFY